MTHAGQDKNRPKQGENREDRLKAALKANMAKRKAQARARASGQSEHADNQSSDTEKGQG